MKSLDRIIRRTLDSDRRFGSLKLLLAVNVLAVAGTAVAFLLNEFLLQLAVIFVTYLISLYLWFKIVTEPYRYFVALNVTNAGAVVDRLYPLLGESRFRTTISQQDLAELKGSSWVYRFLYKNDVAAKDLSDLTPLIRANLGREA